MHVCLLFSSASWDNLCRVINYSLCNSSLGHDLLTMIISFLIVLMQVSIYNYCFTIIRLTPGHLLSNGCHSIFHYRLKTTLEAALCKEVNWNITKKFVWVLVAEIDGSMLSTGRRLNHLSEKFSYQMVCLMVLCVEAKTSHFGSVGLISCHEVPTSVSVVSSIRPCCELLLYLWVLAGHHQE